LCSLKEVAQITIDDDTVAESDAVMTSPIFWCDGKFIEFSPFAIIIIIIIIVLFITDASQGCFWTLSGDTVASGLTGDTFDYICCQGFSHGSGKSKSKSFEDL